MKNVAGLTLTIQVLQVAAGGGANAIEPASHDVQSILGRI
jgi:hypothetical protein